MERMTRANIGSLKFGDRFFMASDRHKVVWEKVEYPDLKTAYQTYNNWAITDAMLMKGGNPLPKAFKADTNVVFLRHSYIQLELSIKK